MNRNAISICTAWLLCACSSSVPRSLADARAANQRCAQGPAAQLAPAQVHAAQTSLAIAEQTFDDEGDSQSAHDRAYVAQRKAELAEVQAAIVTANQEAEVISRRGEADKERIRQATATDLENTRAQLSSEQARRQDAERRAADALTRLANVASVKQETRGTVITLSGEVIFASGKVDLLTAARTRLDQVALALKESDASAQFIVEGYTDSRGSIALNQDLSSRRAATVRDYLVSRGVPANRITSRGLGPANPIADNETAEGRANNRRVEIVVKNDDPREGQVEVLHTKSSPGQEINRQGEQLRR